MAVAAQCAQPAQYEGRFVGDLTAGLEIQQAIVIEALKKLLHSGIGTSRPTLCCTSVCLGKVHILLVSDLRLPRHGNCLALLSAEGVDCQPWALAEVPTEPPKGRCNEFYYRVPWYGHFFLWE